MSRVRVDGVRGELLALCSHLPRCGRRGCSPDRARPPIATWTDGETYLCGACATPGGIRRQQVVPLAYRRLVRWLLGVVRDGAVIDHGRTLTLAEREDLDELEALPAAEPRPASADPQRVPPLGPAQRTRTA